MSKVQSVETKGKVITCILPKGGALPLMEALLKKGVTRFVFAFARGSDIDDVANSNGLPIVDEKEVLTVMAKDELEGEELFDFIFEEGNINRPDGGIIYMSKLSAGTPFVLPEIQNQAQEVTPSEDKRPPEAGV